MSSSADNTPYIDTYSGRAGAHRWTWGRTSILLLFMGAWGALILFRMGQLMLFPGEKLLKAVHQDTWISGEIPAPRGCILDQNGRPLAWSTRQFSLYWRVPVDPLRAGEEQAILRQYIRNGDTGLTADGLRAAAGQAVVVKSSVTAREMEAVARLKSQISGLDLRSASVRHRTSDPALARILGTVRMIDGRETGLSGVEKAQDAVLAGKNGRFRVMVDRNGNWMKETWQKTGDMRPGYDVYLPIRADGAVAYQPAPTRR